MDDYKNLTQEEIINIRRIKSKNYKDALKKARLPYCFLCGKEVKGFCNSHSIPSFILKEISDEGYVYNFSSLLGMEQIIGEKVGLNTAGVFSMICNDCDQKFFKDYESKDKIVGIYNKIKNKKIDNEVDKVLALIYIKSILKSLFRKRIDVYEMKEIYDNFDVIHNEPYVSNMNVNDYMIEFKKCEEVLHGNQNIIVYESIELPYKVSFCTQSLISLQNDIDNQCINNVFCMDPNYHIVDICICMFPFDDKSYIFIFGLENSKQRYKNLFRKYKKLTHQQKLKLIQTIIFSYSEEVYISKELLYYIKQDSKLIFQCRQGTSLDRKLHSKFSNVILQGKIDIDNYELQTNYLDRKYSVKSLKNRKKL